MTENGKTIVASFVVALVGVATVLLVVTAIVEQPLAMLVYPVVAAVLYMTAISLLRGSAARARALPDVADRIPFYECAAGIQMCDAQWQAHQRALTDPKGPYIRETAFTPAPYWCGCQKAVDTQTFDGSTTPKGPFYLMALYIHADSEHLLVWDSHRCEWVRSMYDLAPKVGSRERSSVITYPPHHNTERLPDTRTVVCYDKTDGRFLNLDIPFHRSTILAKVGPPDPDNWELESTGWNDHSIHNEHMYVF